MPAGRPTKYGPKILARCRDYIERFSELGDVVPSQAGLALHIGVVKSTVQEWAKDPKKAQFSALLMQIDLMQERGLVNGGLKGDMNPVITKMLLTKHGYTDKVEQTVQGPEGGAVQVEAIVTVEAGEAYLRMLNGNGKSGA